MNLNPLHIEILKGVRSRIECSDDGFTAYICYAIEDEIHDRYAAESALRENRIFFWRRQGIWDRLETAGMELRSAVQYGIGSRPTVGTWLHSMTDHIGINVPDGMYNNLGLYKLARLAWIDRSLDTGELR